MKGATLVYLEQADRDVPRCSGCGVFLTEATVPVDSAWEGDLCARCSQKAADVLYAEECDFRSYADKLADEADEALFFEREDREAFGSAAADADEGEDDYDWDLDADFDSLLETTLNQTVA